jgi:hypothetical protein
VLNYNEDSLTEAGGSCQGLNPLGSLRLFDDCLVLHGQACPGGYGCRRCLGGKYDRSGGSHYSLILKCRKSNSLYGSLLLRHGETGQCFSFSDDVVSRSLYRFRRVCTGLERTAREFGLSVYFLTLTLRGDEVASLNSSLDDFLSFLRMRFKRAGERLYFVWVVELQKKRYYKSGVLALHWHFVILAPHGSLPDVKFTQHSTRHYRVVSEGSIVDSSDLFKRWGHGQVLCGYAWSGVRNYLEKYFTKEYEGFRGYKPEWFKLRRFGHSRLGYRGFPEWAYQKVACLSAEGVPVDSLYIERVGAEVRVSGGVDVPGGWDKEIVAGLRYDVGFLARSERLLLFRFSSPWKRYGDG